MVIVALGLGSVACDLDGGILGPPNFLEVKGTVTVAGEYAANGQAQVGPPYVDVINGAYQLIEHGCTNDVDHRVRAVLLQDSVEVAEQWSRSLECGTHFIDFRFP